MSTYNNFDRWIERNISKGRAFIGGVVLASGLTSFLYVQSFNRKDEQSKIEISQRDITITQKEGLITLKDEQIKILKDKVDSCTQSKGISKFTQDNKNVLNNNGTIDNKNGTFINGDHGKVNK